MFHVHFGVFLGVHHGGNGNTEVGGRAPEVYNVETTSQPMFLALFPHIPTNQDHSFQRQIAMVRSRNAPPLASMYPPLRSGDD